MSGERGGGRLRRGLAEFFLIVAGVSVALGADALWEYRSELDREREYLEQIRADLTANIGSLEEALSSEAMTESAVQSAIDAVVSGGPIAPDSVQLWLHERRGLSYADPRLLTGTIDALVNTGDLRLVRDASIRQGLVSYLPRIEQDQSEFDRWVGLGIDHIEQLRIIGMRASPAGTRPDLPANYALTHASEDPGVLEALHGLLQKQRGRRVYLERMLESTQILSELLDS